MSSIFGGISVETPKYTVLRALGGGGGAELRKYAPQVRAEVTYDSPPGSGVMDNLNSPFRMLAGFIFGGNTSRAGGGSEKVEMTAPVVMQKGAPAAASEKIAMTAPVIMTKAPAGGGADASPHPSPSADADAAAAAAGPSQAAPGASPGPASSSSPPSAPAPSAARTMAFVMPSKFASPEALPVPKDARVRLVELPERTYAAVAFKGWMSDQVAAKHEADLRAAAAAAGVALSAAPGDVQYGAYNPPWCLPWMRTNDILIPVAAEH